MLTENVRTVSSYVTIKNSVQLSDLISPFFKESACVRKYRQTTLNARASCERNLINRHCCNVHLP